MQTYKDKNGQDWAVELTIGAMKRVLALTKLDLRNPTAPSGPELPDGQVSLSARMELDQLLLADVLFAVCYPQAQDRGVTQDQFADLLAPETVKPARDAFFAEWSDFFRRSGTPQMAAILDKQTSMVSRAVDLAAKQWDSQKVEARIDQLIDEELDTLGRTLTTSLESAVSTPTGSPSGSS